MNQDVFFNRCNLSCLRLEKVCAHEGVGHIRFARIAQRTQIEGCCNFIDFAIIPPGVSIGQHAHTPKEEEFYLILSGEGQMLQNGESFRVASGDVVRNPPGSAHSLINDGNEDLRLFVFELETHR